LGGVDVNSKMVRPAGVELLGYLIEF